jgi:hypothetical protein
VEPHRAGRARVARRRSSPAATLRGDLTAPLAGSLASSPRRWLLTRAVRRTRRLAGTRHRTAHTIAQNRGPLTRESAREEAGSSGRLRREILAATELAEAVHPPPARLAEALRTSPRPTSPASPRALARVRHASPPRLASFAHPSSPSPAWLSSGPSSPSGHPPVVRGFALLCSAPRTARPRSHPSHCGRASRSRSSPRRTQEAPIARCTTPAAASASSPAPASTIADAAPPGRRAARDPRLRSERRAP